MAQPQNPLEDALNSGVLNKNVGVNPTANNQPPQKNSIAPSPIGKTAQDTADNLFAVGDSYQDYNKYGKISAYDAGPSGASRDRYLGYGRKTFEKIGFVPGMNNETKFNEGTTAWDETWRMLTKAVPLYVEGFTAPLKSYLDVGRGDFGQDIRASANYEKASSVGYSSKSGVLPFINNNIMSFAYTAGIITEAAAEAYLLKKVSPSTFTQISNIANEAKTAGSFLKTGLEYLKDVKNVDAARNFYNTSISKAVNFVNPVTHSWKNFSSTILKNPDNLTNLAKAQRTFGAFYLDARMLNSALSEGRLEGGFVETQAMNEFYNEHYYRTGQVPNEQEMAAYKKQAENAGMMDTMLNTALIFYSNKVSFPNLMRFGSFNGLEDVAVEGGKFIAGKSGLKFVRNSFGNALRSLYKPKEFAKAGLSYFKENLMEGVEETMQEAIAESTKEYYKESFYHPNKANFDYATQTLKKGILSQLDMQGLETFGSGFVMGFGNKVLNYGVGKVNDFKAVYDGKLSYGEYIDQRTKSGEDLADTINGAYNTVSKFYGDRFFDYGNQSLVSRVLDDKDADPKEKIDAKDTAFLSGVITALNTGTFDMFIDKFKDIKQMTPIEVEDSLKLQAGEGEKAIARMDKIISKAERVQKRFTYITEKYKNPIKVTNYKEGTKEREDAELYSKAWEAAKFNAIFLNESYDENVERLVELGKSFESVLSQSTSENPIYQTDLNAIHDRYSLASEVDILSNEITAMEGIEDPKLQKEKEAKQKKLARLQKYKEAQDNFIVLRAQLQTIQQYKDSLENLTPEEQELAKKTDEELITAFNKNEKEYKDALVDYLKDLTGSNSGYFKLERNLQDEGKGTINDIFQKLIDIDKLDRENKTLLAYVNMLNDPAAFRDHVDRNYKWMKTMYLNKKDAILKSVEEVTKSKEYEALLNDLSNKGIFIDLDEFAKWVKNNEYQPESFIDMSSEMVIPKGSELYDQYYAQFIAIAQAQKQKIYDDKDDEIKLKSKINDLLREKDKQFKLATEKYNEALKKKTGFTASELIAKRKEFEEEQQTKIAEVQPQIDILNNLKVLIASASNQATILSAIQAFSNAQEGGLIDKVLVQGKMTEIENSEEALDAIVLLQKQILTLAPNIDSEAAFNFALVRYMYDDVVDSSVQKLQLEIPTEENPFIDPETTEEYNTYKTEIDQIEKDFVDREKEIREASKNFTDDEAISNKKQITALSEWDDIVNQEPELAKLLEENFKTYLDKIGQYEEYDIPAIRQEWLKTQGRTINEFMNKQVGTSSQVNAIRSEVPILKTAPQKVDVAGELKSLDQMTLTELKNFRNILEEKLKVNKKLTPADKNNLKSDIDAVQGYIEFRRTQKPLEKYQEQTEILKEKLFDRQSEIEKVKGTGYVIDKDTPEEKRPQRATELVQKIESEMVPEKPPFLAKSLYDPVALSVINAFVFPEGDVKATPEARVNTFIETVRNLQKQGKLYEFKTEKKLKTIEESLLNLLKSGEEVQLGEVLQLLADIAYSEATTAGNVMDSMIPDFLEFKEPKLPPGMTTNSPAYKAMFGPRGVITELRDSAIDGQFTFIANHVKVFDKELGPLDENGVPRGLAGEMDILMVNNEDLSYRILDIKTAKKDNWDFFNIDDQKTKAKENLDILTKQREAEQDTAKQKQLDKKIQEAEEVSAKLDNKFSKRLAYSIQQTIYRNLFYRMTGIMPLSISLLPIQIDYDKDGNIKTAKLADQIVSKDSKGNKKSIIELTPVEEVNKYVPVSEVKPTITPTQGEGQVNETNLVSNILDDNLSKPFMYKGIQGTLIYTEDGKYAIETPTEIIDITSQGKNEVSPDADIFKLGLTPISIISDIGELQNVDGKTFRITNLNTDTDTITINGIDYEIQRTPKRKQVNGVAFMSNQAAIKTIDEKIRTLYDEIVQRRAGQREGESINDYVKTNASKTFELNQLIENRKKLVAENKRRVSTGGNVNDIIFVINKALAYQNSKTDSLEEQLQDLDEIKKLFGSDRTFTDLMDIFEVRPAAFAKLLDQGYDALSADEIATIESWSVATFFKLERMALVNEDTEIQNALSFLSNILNNIKLIKLSADDQIKQIKDTNEETGSGPSTNPVQQSGPSQPTNVPGQQTGVGTEGATQEIERLRAEEQTKLLAAIPNIGDFPNTYGEIQDKMPDDLYAIYKPIYDEYNAKITAVSSKSNVALDPLLKRSAAILLANNNVSAMLLQRKLRINADRALSILKQLESIGIISSEQKLLVASGGVIRIIFENLENNSLEQPVSNQASIQQINDQVLGVKPIDTETNESLVGYNKVKDAFAKATEDTIDDVYYGFIKDAIAGQVNISPEAIEKLYKERKQQVSTQEIVSKNDIIKGDVLISLIPIFTDEADELFTVTKVNETTGKVTVKNLDNKRTKTYTAEQILENFKRGSMESKPISKEDIIIQEDTKKLAEETATDIESFVNNATAVNAIVEKFDNLSTDEADDELAAAAKKCNI